MSESLDQSPWNSGKPLRFTDDTALWDVERELLKHWRQVTETSQTQQVAEQFCELLAKCNSDDSFVVLAQHITEYPEKLSPAQILQVETLILDRIRHKPNGYCLSRMCLAVGNLGRLATPELALECAVTLCRYLEGPSGSGWDLRDYLHGLEKLCDILPVSERETTCRFLVRKLEHESEAGNVFPLICTVAHLAQRSTPEFLPRISNELAQTLSQQHSQNVSTEMQDWIAQQFGTSTTEDRRQQ